MRRILVAALALAGLALWMSWGSTADRFEERAPREGQESTDGAGVRPLQSPVDVQEVDHYDDPRIAGVVVDSAGVPIPNVRVHFEKPPVSVVSDAQGKFVSPELEAGLHSVTTERDGYAPTYETFVRGDVGVQLRMERTCSVEGQVLGPGGEPVAGVCVQSNGRTVWSDSDGTFELGGLPPGELVIRGSAFLPSQWEVQPGDCAWFGEELVAVEPGETVHDVCVRLGTPRLSKLDLRFTDVGGEPLRGLAIEAQPALGQPEPVTNESGRWRAWFDEVPGEEFLLFIGEPPMWRRMRLQHPDATVLTVKLDKPRTVRLRVQDANGEVLNSPFVAAREAAAARDEAATVTRKADDGSGELMVTVDCFAGDVDYELIVAKTGFLCAVTKARIPPPGGSLTVTLLLAGDVTGRVTRQDGGGVEGVEITVGTKIATTGEGGQFRLQGVAPGTYQVAAWTPEGGAEETAYVAAGETTRLRDLTLVPHPRVTGMVTQRDGAPIGAAEVFVCHGAAFRYAGWSEADGRISIPVEGDGGTWVLVGRDGLSSDLQHVSLKSSPQFTLDDEAVVEIEYDQELPRFRVVCDPACPAEPVYAFVPSWSGASVSLHGLPIGVVDFAFDRGEEGTLRVRRELHAGKVTHVKLP